MGKRYFVFVCSVFLNALGNALMLKGDVGASAWTAAFDNVSNLFGISAGTAANLIFISIFIISKIIGKDFTIKRAVIMVVGAFCYGYMVDGYLAIIGTEQSSVMALNYVYAIAGVVILSASIALAIKANAGYLAIDDFFRNLKIHVFNGNTERAQLATNLFALAVGVIAGLLYGQVTNVTILSIIILFAVGHIVAFFEKVIHINFHDDVDEDELVDASRITNK